MRLRLPIISTVFVVSLALSACGGGGNGSDGSNGSKTSDTGASEQPSTGNESVGGATEIEIVDFAYDPGDVEAKVGDTISFTNSDSAKHTATSVDGSPTAFDTGDIDGDGTAEVTFNEPGDYSYYCSIHEYMKGTIRVLE